MKRFDGWTPLEETEHLYDDGRLVRSTTRHEPEWDEQERAWALAWLQYQASIHESCGHYLPDSTAPEADEGYVVDAAVRCHACTARAQAYKRYEDTRHPEALIFPARRKG